MAECVSVVDCVVVVCALADTSRHRYRFYCHQRCHFHHFLFQAIVHGENVFAIVMLLLSTPNQKRLFEFHTIALQTHEENIQKRFKSEIKCIKP